MSQKTVLTVNKSTKHDRRAVLFAIAKLLVDNTQTSSKYPGLLRIIIKVIWSTSSSQEQSVSVTLCIMFVGGQPSILRQSRFAVFEDKTTKQ